MKKTVVSFADGAGHYSRALMRLELSLKQTGFDGTFKGINDYGHIGAPPHRGPGSVPYAFKPLSMRKAIEEGAQHLLWCDSPVYATKSIQPVFDHIAKHGYLLFDNIGFSVGDYTSDACLNHFGISRNDSFQIPMLMACVMGFDVSNPLAAEFLDLYFKAGKDGITFPGSWTNFDCEVSYDLRCKGHRHDQSVASILAYKLGMTITNAQSTFFAYETHKGVVPVSDTVCLWSGGL